MFVAIPNLEGERIVCNVAFDMDAKVNLDTIAETGMTEVSPSSLHEKGLVRKNSLVKILGRGEISTKIDVSAHAFSKSAEESITAAGGTVTVLPNLGAKAGHLPRGTH